ncbi:unnamed protein product [Aureobasidium pullulans]|nr:unnamed protein product [Aureobasidium pullulans]
MAGDKIPYVFPRLQSLPPSRHTSEPSSAMQPPTPQNCSINWKANTAVMGLAVFTVAAVFFSLSADREHRYKMPEQGPGAVKFANTREHLHPRTSRPMHVYMI